MTNYQILCVGRYATVDEIEKTYRKKVREVYPNQNPLTTEAAM